MAMWAILANKMWMEAIFIPSGSKHLPVLESSERNKEIPITYPIQVSVQSET